MPSWSVFQSEWLSSHLALPRGRSWVLSGGGPPCLCLSREKELQGVPMKMNVYLPFAVSISILSHAAWLDKSLPYFAESGQFPGTTMSTSIASQPSCLRKLDKPSRRFSGPENRWSRRGLHLRGGLPEDRVGVSSGGEALRGSL